MPLDPSLGFNKPLTPSPELAAIVGADPLPRTAVVADLWTYIKTNSLQDPADKRTILADDKLRPIIGERCNMMKLAGLLNKHLNG